MCVCVCSADRYTRRVSAELPIARQHRRHCLGRKLYDNCVSQSHLFLTLLCVAVVSGNLHAIFGTLLAVPVSNFTSSSRVEFITPPHWVGNVTLELSNNNQDFTLLRTVVTYLGAPVVPTGLTFVLIFDVFRTY